MSGSSDASSWGKKLVYKITCPNCWHSFFPKDILFVAKHPDLVGDPVVGEDEFLRFEPTRFTVEGKAIDPRGMATADLACPRCHLQIPETMLEIPPMFISIIGSPASGKSYFLTTMSWELRRVLPSMLLAFSDVNPFANSAIHEYESTLFLSPHPDTPTEIRKTQSDDPRLTRRAMIEGTPVRFPIPLQFLIWPTAEHENYVNARRIGRIAVMYDNAGEDFLPSSEGAESATIQHLAKSQILFALFDPTQDPRFRAACSSDDPQLTHGLRPDQKRPSVLFRQETVLTEAGVRIRRHLGIAQDKRIGKPLIVIVPKFDVWDKMTNFSLDVEPYDGDGSDPPLRMDVERVEQASKEIRKLFQRLCPEFVATAEGLSENVHYIPVSSLGTSPELVKQGDRSFYGIRPSRIKPKWVTVPLLFCLHKWAGALISRKNGDNGK